MSLLNQKQAQKPIVPVRTKNPYETISMYPKYKTPKTGFVILELCEEVEGSIEEEVKS